MEYVDYGNRAYRGGLKHMKVEPKVIQQYEDTSNLEHCIMHSFMIFALLALGS